MKILYIHQYFRTPEQGGAVRSYHLAKGLVEAGHSVELITGYDGHSYDQQWIDGIKVHYLPVAYDQKFSFWKRIWAFWAFVNQSKKLIQKISRPDLLYVTSTPLSIGWIGLWAKRKLALPYIFEVRDLWPEAPIQVGAIRNPILIGFLKKLEKRIYAQSMRLVALSPGIAAHLKKITPEKEVALIPNFADLETFFPKEKNVILNQDLQLNPGLTIAYTGALGKVNAVDELVDLAHLAQIRGKSWNFLIMGDGSEKSDLIKKSEKLNLKNIHFLPFGPKKQVNEVLSLADWAWISFAHFPVLKTNSPNKFFDALAAGKPILVNHKGWVYDLVKTHQIGIPFLPGKWEKSFDKLAMFENQHHLSAQMGNRARLLAEQVFSKDQAVSRLLETIQPSQKSTPGAEVDIRTA